jgi:hypothetical protein
MLSVRGSCPYRLVAIGYGWLKLKVYFTVTREKSI